MNCNQNDKRKKRIGLLLLGLFVLWTALLQMVDVKPAGEAGTAVGFSGLNIWFHGLTGVHFGLYTATDWLGLVPVGVCLVFGLLGLVQLLKRKSFWKVDRDLLVLGGYYILVILCYLLFEELALNHRPVLIDGRAEASYPSSTTLLVMTVMPTLSLQAGRRLKGTPAKKGVTWFSRLFTAAMVIGRLVSGVHWLTDIVGSVLLSAGLDSLYRAADQACCKPARKKE